MNFGGVKAILTKELLDLARDRRSLISMLVVPLVVFPLLIGGMMRLIPKMEEQAAKETQKMGIGARVMSPEVRAALERTGLPLRDLPDFKASIDKKEIAAAVVETTGPDGSPVFEVLADESAPASAAAGDRLREVLGAVREVAVRARLQKAGVDPAVLRPFEVKRTNVAGERKMAGALWGSMLGYVLLLLMFTGGMYPIMDMTAGEKERKTMEALLAAPVGRRDIVVGKTLTAIISILLTAGLTLGSMVISMKNAGGGGLSAESKRLQSMMGVIPLDAGGVALLGLTLLPLAVFAACTMFAIALKARSYKEAQTYLTPMMFLVIFPALLGGIPGLKITPVLCLIPIFNASQIIRGILVGDVAMVNFGVTLAANLAYAGISVFFATRMYDDENVLFRS